MIDKAGDVIKELFGMTKNMLYHPIGERNLLKEIIVCCVCVILYVAFIVLLFSPAAAAIFDFIRQCVPFIELLDGALKDINIIFGSVAAEFNLGTGADTVFDIINEMTLKDLMINLCKIVFASFFQRVLFTLFSKLFLYGNDHSISDKIEQYIFTGNFSNTYQFDLLYFINKKLLYGISLLIGTLAGGYIIYLLTLLPPVSADYAWTVWFFVILFFVLYALDCVFFIFRANKKYSLPYESKSKIKYTFRKSLIKRILCNIIPDCIEHFATDLILVCFVNCCLLFGVSTVTVIAGIIAFIWVCVAAEIKGVLSLIAYADIPFCGKKCPISGIFCVLTTICTVAFMYLIATPNYPYDENSLEQVMLTLPFIHQWTDGASITYLTINEFPTYLIDTLNLLVICTIVAQLQYVSSSYTWSLPTQIVFRLIFIMGIILACPLFINCILVFFAPEWVAAIEYVYLAILVAILLYLIFFVIQPWIAVYGIVSAGAFIVCMDIIPYSAIKADVSSYNKFLFYLAFTFAMLILNLILALIENVVAYVEKRMSNGLSFVDAICFWKKK